MGFSINKVFLVGNITADPELKYTPKGTATMNLGVATNHSYKDGEEWKDVPSFHRVQIWGKTAEFIANSVSKGDKVYVDGRVSYRTYEAKDGQTKYITEIVADNVIPHAGKRKETEQTAETTVDDFPDKEEPMNEDVDPDDIPF